MQLISINIGKEQTQQRKDYIETTGIYKKPVNEPVEIKSLGIEGDAICDTKNHGGPDQAIYVYGGADYDWWSNELGRELAPGTFGDNLTISESGKRAIQRGRLPAHRQLNVTSHFAAHPLRDICHTYAGPTVGKKVS